MSNLPPPDRPTEPIAQPRPVTVATERVVAPQVDPNVILLRLEDAIESLRTWIVVVGIVAVAALCVALYAVLDDDEAATSRSSSGGLARDDDVSRLDGRIDRLSRQVQDLRADGGDGGSAALADRLGDLESTVKSLPSQPAAGGTQQAVDELSQRIDDLAGEVDELKQTSTQP